MRKSVSIIMVTLLMLSLVTFVGGCKKKGVSGTTAELFALIPANSTGVISINLKKIVGLPIYDTFVKEMDTKMKAAAAAAVPQETTPAVEAETTTPTTEEGEATVREGEASETPAAESETADTAATTEGENTEAAPAETEVTTTETPQPEPPMFESYNDFVQKMGIDPKKDLIAIAIAFTGKQGFATNDPDVVVVMQLNYNKNTLLEFIKSKNDKFTEEAYNGIAIYKSTDAKGKEGGFAFINEKTIAAGTLASVKEVIDLSKGTGKSIMTNETMAPYFKNYNSDAILAFAFPLPAELKKPSTNPMMKVDLSKAEAITGFFDYAGNTYTGEVNLVSKDKAANDQIATVLNGLKGLASAGGPEFGELANNITITASSDAVTLKAKLTDELIKKLEKKKAESKTATGM